MPALIPRRSLLGLAVALVCPLCARAAVADAPHWGYEGATGPEHWGDLSADFRTCAERQRYPVGSRSIRICSIAVNLPHPARRQQNRRARDVVRNTFLVENCHTGDPT